MPCCQNNLEESLRKQLTKATVQFILSPISSYHLFDKFRGKLCFRIGIWICLLFWFMSFILKLNCHCLMVLIIYMFGRDHLGWWWRWGKPDNVLLLVAYSTFNPNLFDLTSRIGWRIVSFLSIRSIITNFVQLISKEVTSDNFVSFMISNCTFIFYCWPTTSRANLFTPCTRLNFKCLMCWWTLVWTGTWWTSYIYPWCF